MSRFKPLILSAFALTLLSGCATLVEGASQEVTFEAKGATDVMCNLKNTSGELSYKVYPPQRIWMKRSRTNIIADCYAPGNRHKVFEIVTGVEPWTAGNVTNGIAPGVTYDAYSRAFFKYPSVVVIDMSDTVATPDLPPSYHSGDGLDPQDMSKAVEDMGPKTPALAGDDAAKAARAAAFEEYEREQEMEAEREARKAMYDPGVKK